MKIDPKGRVSGNRNLTLLPKANFSSALANQKFAAAVPQQPRLITKKEIKLDEEIPDATKNPYFDSNIRSSTGFAPQKRPLKAEFKFAGRRACLNP